MEPQEFTQRNRLLYCRRALHK